MEAAARQLLPQVLESDAAVDARLHGLDLHEKLPHVGRPDRSAVAAAAFVVAAFFAVAVAVVAPLGRRGAPPLERPDERLDHAPLLIAGTVAVLQIKLVPPAHRMHTDDNCGVKFGAALPARLDGVANRVTRRRGRRGAGQRRVQDVIVVGRAVGARAPPRHGGGGRRRHLIAALFPARFRRPQ